MLTTSPIAAEPSHPTASEGGQATKNDRSYADLMQGVRVVQCGAQVMLAFLLGLAFTNRFETITTAQRAIYVTALLLGAVAIGLLITPAAFHHLVSDQELKNRLLPIATQLVFSGMALMLLTVATSLLLVLDVAIGGVFAFIVTAPIVFGLTALWFVWPLRTR